MTQRRPLIVQQEKIARIGRVGHIDRIVDGRRLCQRVITQPRPIADIVPAGEQSMSASQIIQRRERSFAIRTKS